MIGERAELLSRDVELAAMGEFVATRDRLPAAMLVRGEPGIGKRLLRDLRVRA